MEEREGEGISAGKRREEGEGRGEGNSLLRIHAELLGELGDVDGEVVDHEREDEHVRVVLGLGEGGDDGPERKEEGRNESDSARISTVDPMTG